jgi:preprotein translocase subunit SecG
MESVLIVVHLLIALGIIGLVLIQHGKGADAGAAFGAGAAGGVSGSVFGAQGSGNFLSRTTAILATLFFVTSLSMAYMAKDKEQVKSLMEQQAPVVEKTTEPKKDSAATDAPVIPDETTKEAPATSTTSDAPELPKQAK